MKKIALTFATASLMASPVVAKGCLKGAAVGGVAGHFVGRGHAVAGAAIGCVIGHHRAKVAAQKQARAHNPPKH